jgi:hypothetical protein
MNVDCGYLCWRAATSRARTDLTLIGRPEHRAAGQYQADVQTFDR